MTFVDIIFHTIAFYDLQFDQKQQRCVFWEFVCVCFSVESVNVIVMCCLCCVHAHQPFFEKMFLTFLPFSRNNSVCTFLVTKQRWKWVCLTKDFRQSLFVNPAQKTKVDILQTFGKAHKKHTEFSKVLAPKIEFRKIFHDKKHHKVFVLQTRESY